MGDTSQDQELKVNPTDQPPGTGVSLNLSDIEAFKDRLEQQKANKLKAEQLVNTLSRIKAREKATRRTIKPGENKNEDSISSQPIKRTTSNTNALKEKSNLLKKKLEEDRAKFESKKEQEDLERVSEIVEHIRVQLEGQDKTIQQIHSNFAATTKGTQPVENVVPAVPDIPPEVKQKITDLEMKILDLQENLREKDSVISARTQAITLLSEDMARKGKNTLDTLEETRCQMKAMQANFIALEDRMNEEKTRLREEVETKKLRLQQIEKNYRTAESARFDLSTRVAELQEKIVVFQTKNLSLEKEVVEATNKSKELKEALENSNKQTIKMKAQFKAKLRSVEEERDMLRKEDRSNEELTRLRERIADLEDEKEAGNLLKERISEMEEKLQRQECDLDSHIKAITSLETERLDLLQAINKKSTVMTEKEDMLELMQRQISHLEESKITAEMKCLELEEKLDNFIKSETDASVLHLELEKAKEKLVEYQDTINELNMKLQNRESESNNSQFFEDQNELKNIQDMTSNLVEWQNRYSALEQNFNATLAHCEELKQKKKDVELDNEKLVNDCNKLRETVNNLNSILTTKSECPNEEIYSLREELAKKETEISNLNKHSQTLATEVDNLRHALQSTTSQVHDLYQQVEDLSYSRQKVQDLSSILTDKEKELAHTTSALDERSRKLSEYKKFHKIKSEDVLRISHELETVSVSSQQRISELEEFLSAAKKVEEGLRREIKDLKDCENKEPEVMDTKLQEQSVKIKKLAANVKLKTKLIKDLEAKIETLNSTVHQNEVVICSLENEKANLQKQLVACCEPGNHLSLNLNTFEEKCKILELEVESLKEELISKTKDLESLKNSSSEKYETVVQIKELENQNQKLNDIAETKSDQLRKMEDEIADLNGLNKSLLSELEQMQESYKQDALKNESVLDSFEHEMLGNKKDIQELSNQLKDVTSKYEQTWAKLQEKEGYIEDLEQQLEKVKFRLLQIESTVEERRRSLEEKAEMLGARLCQAEKNNEQLEKHEGELEQKIFCMLNTEEMLGNVLEKLQEENSEMSKSLSESADKNIELSKELDSERNKLQNLTKDINEMQISLLNYEKMVEDFENLKLQLKEAQEARDSQVKYLENCLAESEQCMEGEIRRLSEKITFVETERQEVIDKFNTLLLEKQMLEDEMGNLQQTIADATKEELTYLKKNQESLTEQMNKELEKRQALIHRVQELESQLRQQNMTIEFDPSLNNEEVLLLKKQLERIVKENETLKYELLKEKAKKQVQDVVSKAEQTYFTMISSSNAEVDSIAPLNTNVESEVTRSTRNIVSESPNVFEPVHTDVINKLKHELSVLVSENIDLKSRLQEFESKCMRKMSENAVCLPDGDDWTAVNKDEDDGWGWGSKDAMLEHEYIQKQKTKSELEDKVTDLERKLYNCDVENKKLAEELKTSQTKCNKLLKKLKEFKIKSDSLERNSRERSVGFDDLDIAMQEELRSQVDKLERSLKEFNANINTLQIERENLLKRIDTLTSGNERLVEMKERQDIEVEMWQRRSHELQNTVQGLEWTIAELQESKSAEDNCDLSIEGKQHFLTNALEMEEKLNALAAENDYLQSLISELKDKGKHSNHSLSFVSQMNDDNLDQKCVNDDNYLTLQQEIHRLNGVIETFREKLKIESKSKNVEEYYNRIDDLLKENELLSSSIEKIKNSNYNSSQENVLVSNEDYKLLKSENDQLTSSVILLNEQLSELKIKYEGLEFERNSFDVIINQLKKENEVLNVQVPMLSKNGQSNAFPGKDESPVLFRGFLSSNDDKFELSSSNQSSTLFDNKTCDSKHTTSLSANMPSSVAHSIDFFDTVTLVPDSISKEEIVKHVSGCQETEGEIEEHEVSTLTTHMVEIDNLKTLLQEKEIELTNLTESVTRLEEKNNDMQIQYGKQFTNEEKFKNSVDWSPFTGTSINDANSWNNKLSMLNTKIEEKDAIISDLKNKLDLKDNSSFEEENREFDQSTPNPNTDFDLFSESANDHESQINDFVEQITQLTTILNDKETEIKLLNDKNKKYKEIYYALAKDCAVRRPNKSNSDKEQLTTQNLMLNQLLEDKETELEIMSQQMEQSMVAKENLQDELSLKICEMKAVNSSFDIPELPNEILLHTSQPENIEEVITLCAEVTELTKLLQEKESEVEILKQQVDELRLEKENLLDEWKKEIEEYKEQANRATVRAEEMGKELETFKDVVVSDIEKQYKDEVFLKEQELMNAVNDLRNTHNFCEDMQTRLNSVEDQLKSCCLQNDFITKELNDAKYIQNSIEKLTEEVGDGCEVSLIEKILKLKNELKEIKVRVTEANIEIEEKDKTVTELRDKVRFLESNNEPNNKAAPEEPQSSVQLKSYTSESFRISTEQSSSDDDSSSKLTDNIQGQMFLMKEIQSLKQVLSMKDAEITRLSIALNEAQENLIRGELRFINSEEESLRNRLDEALYTLHLRDVRCDELSLELMQLLEERDSLQLRLSTAIRLNEKLRKQLNQLDEAAIKMECETDYPLKGEDNTNNQQLKEKLDQLHNVGYRKDPGLQQEQQKRHQEQMQLFTHHTSQEDSQQSSGFFSWIFGNSSSGSQDV